MTDTYKIECYVETISSGGEVTVRGVDGFRLEKKEGEKEKTYNVFWKVKAEDAKNKKADEALVKVFPAEEKLSLGKDRKNINLQFLLTAKANHLKVLLEMESSDKIKTISLI